MSLNTDIMWVIFSTKVLRHT